MFNIGDKKLTGYIINHLETAPPDYYDANGDSDRAILSRRRKSYFKSLKHCCSVFLSRYKYAINNLNMDASIGDILTLILYTLIFPIAPFIWEFFTVKGAVNGYRDELKRTKREQ